MTAGGANGEQIAEETELCCEVGFHRRVVVEVIAAEIGEACGFELHAIEAELVEAVGGGFEGEMRDAFVGERCERGMKGDGIGRRQ